jgi:dienelactone hydrolase
MRVGRRTAIRRFSGAALGAMLQPPIGGLTPGLCVSSAVSDFQPFCFTDAEGVRRQVYVKDGGGPPVILLHELPGLVDADLETARKLAKLGYTVVAPLLFGDPGGEGDWLRNSKRVCGRDQFACRHSDVTSPHIHWLRQLTATVRRQWTGGKGVGVIGMCLTGAFPIAMLREPSIAAAVLCQPTVPFNLFTRIGLFTDKRGLGIDPADLLYARKESHVPLLGIRYTGDWRCRRPRFERLAEDFGERFYRLDIKGEDIEGTHHSSLGNAFCDAAFEEVSLFLNQFLRSSPDPQIGRFPRRSRNNSREEVRIDNCRESSHVPHK